MNGLGGTMGPVSEGLRRLEREWEGESEKKVVPMKPKRKPEQAH
jgi:hypothetical protein